MSSLRCAILVHAWNAQHVQELADCASNARKAAEALGGTVALTVVTVPTTHADSKAVMERQFGAGRVVVIPCANRGLDIGGFLVACGYLLDHERTIDVVLKLHTKSNAQWRRRLTGPICGSVDHAQRCLQHLLDDATVGMIGVKAVTIVDPDASTRPHGKDLCRLLLGIDQPQNGWKFVGGTMFWARWAPLKSLFTERARPCLLRKLLNDDRSLDYHWYRHPRSDDGGATRARSIASAEASVRHFEAARASPPGNILHVNNRTPWERRYRDNQIEHGFERVLCYWFQHKGLQVIGV